MQGMAMMSEMQWCPATTASTPAPSMTAPPSASRAPHLVAPALQVLQAPSTSLCAWLPTRAQAEQGSASLDMLILL